MYLGCAKGFAAGFCPAGYSGPWVENHYIDYFLKHRPPARRIFLPIPWTDNTVLMCPDKLDGGIKCNFMKGFMAALNKDYGGLTADMHLDTQTMDRQTGFMGALSMDYVGWRLTWTDGRAGMSTLNT
jgi:hypothetical protein